MWYGSRLSCDEARRLAGRQASDRPGRTVAEAQRLPDARMPFRQSPMPGEDRLGASRLHHIEKRKVHVPRIGAERRKALAAGLLPRATVHGLGGQLAEQRHLSFADHPVGVGGVGADDSSGRPVVVGNGAVGESVVGLLRIAVALHQQELLLDIGPLDATHGGVEQRSDIGPDFLPDFPGRLAERPRVLAADDRLVGVVVEVDQFRSPPDPDRLAGGEHDADGRLQALRPGLRRPQRIAGPIVVPDQGPQFPAAGEKKQRGLLGAVRAIGGFRHRSLCCSAGSERVEGLRLVSLSSRMCRTVTGVGGANAVAAARVRHACSALSCLQPRRSPARLSGFMMRNAASAASMRRPTARKANPQAIGDIPPARSSVQPTISGPAKPPA